MSVIYETLQKLSRQSEAELAEPNGAKEANGIFSIPRSTVLQKVGIVFVISAAVITVGVYCGALFWQSRLQSYSSAEKISAESGAVPYRLQQVKDEKNVTYHAKQNRPVYMPALKPVSVGPNANPGQIEGGSVQSEEQDIFQAEEKNTVETHPYNDLKSAGTLLHAGRDSSLAVKEKGKKTSPQHHKIKMPGNEGAAQDTIHSKNIAKNRHLNQLVSRIQHDIIAGNDARLPNLFAELSRLKGSQHHYVLKLKAFWHMHKKEFIQARGLLRQILAKNADDLEAGINMAVAEVYMGDTDAALKRLTQLKNRYPENTDIIKIIHTLK